MKAVVPVCVLLGACAVWGTAQKPAKTNGEEGRIIALESASRRLSINILGRRCGLYSMKSAGVLHQILSPLTTA